PGTIVIQSAAPAASAPMFIAFGLVALIAVAALVIVLLGGGDRTPEPTTDGATQVAQITTEPTVFLRPTLEPSFGRASFSSSAGEMSGDSLSMRVQGVAVAPGGASYMASLVNTENGDR